MIRGCLVTLGVTAALLASIPAPTAVAGATAAPEVCDLGSSQRPRAVLVRTLPALPGAGIRLDGRALTTDGKGSFTGAVGCPEKLRKRLTLPTVVQIRPGVRQRFARWATASRGTEIFAVYDVERLVNFRFHRLEGESVGVNELEEFVVKSSTGAVTHSRKDSFWLQSERVITTPDGPRVKKLLYGVESVRVDGTDVVRRGQQRFVPADRDVVSVELLYFPITLQTHDTLFGFPVGKAVLLTHPDGRVTRHELDGQGRLALRPLPRGQYSLRLEAPAPAVVHPLALSRPQAVDLAVMSWLDLGVLGGSGLVVALLLLVARRPHLRRRPSSGRAALEPESEPQVSAAGPPELLPASERPDRPVTVGPSAAGWLLQPTVEDLAWCFGRRSPAERTCSPGRSGSSASPLALPQPVGVGWPELTWDRGVWAVRHVLPEPSEAEVGARETPGVLR